MSARAISRGATAALAAALSVPFAGLAAEWIRPAEPPAPERNAAVFAKRVPVRDGLRRATWSVCGQGVFTAYVNGREIGGFLKPGLTQVEKRLQRHDSDVTHLVGTGKVADLRAVVTMGWWRDDMTGRQLRPFREGQYPWYRPQHSAFWGELALDYADGSREIIGTDGGWTAAYQGPVRDAGIFEGERYDAREEGLPPPTAAAVRCDEPAGRIEPRQGPPVVLREDLARRPVGWKGPQRLMPWTRHVFDFGQNCAAVPRFRVEGPSGTVLTLRTGEMLNDTGDHRRGNDGPAGSLYRRNLRTAPSFVKYVLKGGGEEYLPQHTYFGFRYCDIEVSSPVRLVSLESVPVSSVSAEMERGTFACGNPAVTRLFQNARWGMLSNYLSIPTDCPQRNERLGWTADTWVFAETALYNADVAGFLSKWMTDLRDAQSAEGVFPIIAPLVAAPPPNGAIMGWSDAGVIVPYILWRQTGNRSHIERAWPDMERYMDALRATRGPGNMFGDWVHLEKTPFLPFFWAYDAQLMRKMASVIGDAAAARKYGADEAQAKADLRARAVAPDGSLKPTFRGQANGLWALKIGLATNAAEKARLRADLLACFAAATNRLQTGFMGTAILLDTLADEADAPGLAYDLLLSHDYPGWLYSVDQGATTIWERWNSYTKDRGFGPADMNSFNHYAYGCVAGWLYSTVCGIRPNPDTGGYRHFELRPLLDRRLGWARATLRVAEGEIVSSWEYGEDGTCAYRFRIPRGTRATVRWNGQSRVFEAGDHSL